jgi:diguanylate cyclase (GGDEF)-like protein
MSLGSPLVLRYPLLSTLTISLVISGIAVALSVASYVLVGQQNPGVGYEAVSALGIAAVLAPTFLYPWIRTAVRLRLATGELIKAARTDALTGLENPTAFRKSVAEALTAESVRQLLAIHFIDLDRFKHVNDTLGHAVGDALLVSVANRLLSLIGAGDHIARLGGDEFVILQAMPESNEQVGLLAQKVLASLSDTFDIDGHQLRIGASIGIALAPEQGSDVSTLLRHADMALYHAKAKQEGNLRFFDPKMTAVSVVRQGIESALRSAFFNGNLEVDFQPIISLRSMRPTSCEALIRWPTANDGMRSPAQFMPVAEEMGIIGDIGAWVLQQACRECIRWPGGVRVAVNVSTVQLRQGNLHLVVADALLAAALPASRLEIEITESALLEDFSSTRTALDQLRMIGVGVCLDDFGSGYSGLGYLRALSFDKIKTDRSFVSGLPNDNRSLKLLRGIAKLCAELGIAVAVKGVETQAQADLIAAEADFAEIQGFVFSSAVSARRIQELLARYPIASSFSSARNHLAN